MTKPAVWVQFTVKKNRVDEFRSYYDKSDDFEQEEPRKNMEVDLHGFP